MSQEKDTRELYTTAPDYVIEQMSSLPEEIGALINSIYKRTLTSAPEGYSMARAENDAISAVNQTIAFAIYIAAALIADLKDVSVPTSALTDLVLDDIKYRLNKLKEQEQQ